MIIPGNPSPESQVQFRQQLISLIKFLSTAAPPLSLILADCQWADEHSIELINLLLTDPEMDHLLLILSMRSQVSDATVWESFLSEAQHPHFPEPLYLLLGNMDPEAVNAYLAHTLNMAPDQVSDLGEVVHEKTGGNPFFLREFLRTIYLEKHLYFSFKKGSWQWQLQEIRTKAISDNVMKMKSQRFTQLSPEIRKTLKVAACLGIEFDLADLVVHSHQSALSCAIACQEGILEGFLLPLRNAENALRNMLMNSWMDSPDSKDIRRMGIRLRFGHLHLKNMVLETLSEKENIDFHLSIAREKYRILNAREMEAELFDLAEHFRWGLDGLNPVELEQVANLFLRAGRKAQENLAYPAALEYYELGIGILGEEHWRTNYTLLMDLHIFGAESAYLANQPAVMEKLANQAILNADNFPDQVRISEILIQAYIAGNNLASAVETGLATLKILNCQFPEKPSRLQVIGALLKMRYWTARGSLESLPDRPPVSDNLILSQMRIISLVGPVAFFLDPLLSALMILYLAELTFTHGPSPSAPIGISSYGILVNGLLRDYDNAKQLATLTERLLKDFRRPDNFSRAIMILNNFIRPWSQSHLSLVEKSQEGYDAGVQDGDLQFAGYGLAIRTKFAFLGGTPLKILLPDAEKSTKAISSINKSSPWHLHRIWHQMLVEFSGEGPWNGHFNGPHFREEELAQLEKSAELTTIGQYYFCHAMLAIWSNNWEESRTHLQSYGKIRDALMSTMENHYHEIFSLLTDLILHKPSGKRASSLFLLKARQRLKSITRVAERVPEPLAFWEAFIRAEIQRLSNHPNMVIVYRRPVEIANKQGYLPGLALLFERLARQNLAVGNNQLAKFFFQESHNAFRKWGLTRNVKRLELEFPDLFEEYLSRQDGVNRQDYQTLVQTLQALSTEIVVSDLLDTLMTTLLESAGADRGLFFTIEENDLKLAAERAIGEETKTEAGREGHHYLAGALRRVWRTRDYLLLEDATAGGDFVNDPYVLSSQPRSLLCLPVFRLSTLIGILYLENHSLPGAFTPQRLSTLQLLAAQAGISLENARLYENLTEEIADRKRLEQQLLQAQKMEAVGRLAGGVAHDFNNILTVIKGYSGMLVATAGDDEDLLDSAKEIYEAGQRAEALTRQLLAFSRKQILKPEIINLNTILDGMQKMLRRLIGEAVVLQTYPGEGLWNIKADPGQIEQVMMNLTVNARDAMGQGGSISIATSNIELEKAFGELPPGEFVRMSVSDTGTGMAPELIEKIFDPFFTTKPKEQGTGLGLSTVYGIVQQSSGTIKVESTPGKGSTFHIWFPRSEQEIGKNLEQAVSSTNLHGIEKILLVEDQREVRDVIGLSLRRLGYDVVEATDGQEGLEKYLEFQEDIQLILTDMIMPNMNGETLIREIRRDRPGLKVIFMSGYTEIDLPASGLMTENTEFMQKPFSPNAAAMKIRQLIDAK
ncbi:MAG TPA: ATP-binding protein [Calditrichia bacterium]|nr:ATP-binding protein [Calditrichia bacterium]